MDRAESVLFLAVSLERCLINSSDAKDIHECVGRGGDGERDGEKEGRVGGWLEG